MKVHVSELEEDGENLELLKEFVRVYMNEIDELENSYLQRLEGIEDKMQILMKQCQVKLLLMAKSSKD